MKFNVVVGIASCSLVGAFYTIFHFAALDVNTAVGYLGVVLAVVPYVHRLLVLRSRERRKGKGEILNLDEFLISRSAIVLYAALVTTGSTQAASVIWVLITDNFLVDGHVSNRLGLPVVSIAIILYGLWVGARAPDKGVFALLLGVSLGLLVNVGADMLGIFVFRGTKVFQNIGVDNNMDFFDLYLGLLDQETPIDFVISIGRSLVGFCALTYGAFFLGTRKRRDPYVHYLFGKLPEEDRIAFVDLLYDEVKRKGRGGAA
ncbi:MAG: hypothetical protein K9H25_20480 [Rhodospirillum sp.]|nr:hypothetical protein [Rhodospirillum sp.]MCF8491527.1 hypothetical protein [Rhodospirillum sp.]MCF8501407.1 hypothetical protein [Rhodospirillum sp.]